MLTHKLFFSLLLSISLSSAAVILVDDFSDGKTLGTKNGGSFVSGGWDSGKNGQIFLPFGKAISEGGGQLWFTNVDWPKQVPGDKQEIWGGLGPKGHFAVRFGYSNYKTGFKLLSSPSGKPATEPRKENRCVPDYQWGAKSLVHTMKASIKSNKLTVFIDGKSIISHDWGSDTYNLDKIVVGYMKYAGAPGLLWVRGVLWEGTEPSNLDEIKEGASTTILNIHKGRIQSFDNQAIRMARKNSNSLQIVTPYGWFDALGKK